MTLTFLNFNLIKGYIYKVMKKKVGSHDGGLGYYITTNSTQNNIHSFNAFGHVINFSNRPNDR
jgi:hypothetical protein